MNYRDKKTIRITERKKYDFVLASFNINRFKKLELR